jgi:3-oxoadipate enol-lactonase
MPNFRPSPDLDMHYQVDAFTDPWRRPETILMLHGNAESGLAWYAWFPNWRAAIAWCGPTCAASASRPRCRPAMPGASTS